MKKYGIIGKPIKHSLSPLLHNYWLKKYKVVAEYSLLEIEENKIKNTLDKIRSGLISGINVTLPYKQKVIPFVDKIINDAKKTKSVNTIYLNNNKELVGDNTDVFGLQAGYLKEIIDSQINNKKALILGAGGVSPSVIVALNKSNVNNITISNRTFDKAIFLKKNFNNISIIKWEDLKSNINNFDIIINATSLGLKNQKDFDFLFNNFKDSLIYIDTIYNPIETKMIKHFKSNNIKTFGGLDMFIYQAQKSFYLWNKINPEIDNHIIEILRNELK